MTNARTLGSIQFGNALTVNETVTLGTDPTVPSLPSVSSVGSSVWQFDGTLGPSVTVPWHNRVTLSGGVATLDLTALPDPILTTVNANGLKLKVLHVTGKSTNTAQVSLAPGASNPYTGWCKASGGIAVGASDVNALGPLYGSIAVDGTHKTIDLASTDLTASVDITLLFGP